MGPFRRLRDRLFGRSAKADVSARIDHASVAVFRRLNLLEKTLMDKLGTIKSIEDKVDQLKALLDVKTAQSEDDTAALAELGAKVDAILAEHTPSQASLNVPGLSGVAFARSPVVTGLSAGQGMLAGSSTDLSGNVAAIATE